MKLQKLSEGKVYFYASPALGKAAFYNPAAELQRDISISVAQTWQKVSGQKLSICDALSASGVRGLRYAKEVSGIKSVTLNDHNSAAVSVIRRNIKLNKLPRLCKVSHSDANVLLHQNIFNYIDLDPYGSPNLFLDSAARSIWHLGFMAVTATDTAPLSGVYPLTALRKFGILTFKGAPFYSELGLRTLLSLIILALARRDRAFVPVLSHATRHYFRCYGKIAHASSIEPLLKQFGFVSYDPRTTEFLTGPSPPADKRWKFAGPLYLGPLNDRQFVQQVSNDLRLRDFKEKPLELRLLKLLADEAIAPPFYYDLHACSEVIKKKLPTMVVAQERLEKAGYIAVRTHFDDVALKTDAPFSAIKKLFR